MASEKDASCVSMYRLDVNNKDLGKFKSSGILIATGTGSTGWLYSAK
jgi:NAD kinase